MARPRVIDQDEILDAAETVVARDGAVHLTLEAVAAEAGVSKASVVYDYKTKHALIKAVIERKVASETERVYACIKELGLGPNAQIHGHIAAAAHTAPDEMQAVAFNLCSALAQDLDLRSFMKASCGQEIETIVETSECPRGALLAFLAVEGMRLLEILGLHNWPENQRRQILADIGWLAEASPAPASGGSGRP